MGAEATERQEAHQGISFGVIAVLDANVYVSAVIHSSGPPGQLIEQFLRHSAFDLVLSPQIADEVARALRYPKLRKYLPAGFRPERWIAEIALLSTFVSGDYRIERICVDPDDDKYIAAAIEGGAGWLVTGDVDLLAIGRYEQFEIVTPRSFLTLLKRQ